MLKIFHALVFFLLLCSTASAQKVFLNTEQALKLLFKNSTEVVKETHTLTSEQTVFLQKSLGYLPNKKNYTFYLGKTNQKIDGYALIDDEIGKTEPITFVTKINLDGKLEQVEIMIYRETHGHEVTQSRFLNQFKGKQLSNELRINKDIKYITGATLSSNALVKGTRRALTLWQLFYAK